MQTGPVLERTIDYEGYFPGQTLARVQGFGNVLGLFLGEVLQRIDGDSAMGL